MVGCNLLPGLDGANGQRKIKKINAAISKNPAYIQLQALEALKEMSKDPAAKLYFMDSNAPQPLPLMHMGDKR